MPLTEGYPHPEVLETAAWLAAHLHDPDLRILDARASSEYREGHIPGAVSFPAFEPGRPTPFKAAGSFETCSAAEFAAVAGELGIRPTDTVICYDLNGPQAARLWWVFHRFGHAQVRFLHGGIRAWQAAGQPLETAPAGYAPAVYTLGETHDEVACTLPQAIASLDDASVVFWDTRTPEEYSGARAMTNPPDRAGHIPRAVHLEWNELVDPATAMFRPAEEMRRILTAKGITPEMEVVTY